ncbi:hypothetical protein Tco_1172539 [Tanacetum coccineum]
MERCVLVVCYVGYIWLCVGLVLPCSASDIVWLAFVCALGGGVGSPVCNKFVQSNSSVLTLVRLLETWLMSLCYIWMARGSETSV